MVAIVEEIDVENNCSHHSDFNIKETKYGYDLFDSKDRLCFVGLRTLEPQYLGDNNYLIEVREK